MATVKFGTFAKRRNSTKQPTTELSDQRTVCLKEACSQDKPVFICTGNNFNYNYCEWDSKYYFIVEIISLRNNEIEVHCILDALATYKSNILASTLFVSYSSQSGGTWLPDTRIPVLKSTTTARSTTSLAALFNTTGFYVLTATGKDGCRSFACDSSHLNQLLDHINSWQDDIVEKISDGTYYSTVPYDFSTDEKTAIESLGKMLIQSGAIGNAYAQAPSCIRSCIWVPFFASPFADGGAQIFLGNFDCQLSPQPFKLKATPVTDTVSVTIPWIHSDWRRMYDDVYIYLPLAGMIQLSSDSLTNVSSLSVSYSATATDGVVAYTVKAGGNVIGTFGGQCSANYPIGINQQASAGEILQSIMAGAESMVNAAINSSISPVSMAASGVGVALEGVNAAYNTANVANSTHASTIGGVGGGAGVGLDLDIQCYVVSHDTVITPSSMKDTMGLPTMQPMSLATLTGFCQCANAHIEAPATAEELDALDYFVNSGFFIE